MAKKTDKNFICSMDDHYSDCVAKLLEAGKTVDEICGAFPEYEDQIRKFCEVFRVDKAAKLSKPSEQGSVPQAVDRSPDFGLFDPVRAIISSRKALLLAAAVFVLLVIGNAAWLAVHSGSSSFSQVDNNSITESATDSQQVNIAQTEGDQVVSALPEPTGKIDDTLAEVSSFINQEDSALAGESDDIKLIPLDNAAIDNFSTIYPQTSEKLATCDDINSLITQVALNTADRTSSLAVAQAGRLNSIIGGRNSRDNHVEARRSASDSQLERDYDKMSLVAEGGAQKQGVSDFRVAIGAAIATRRAAIDAAQSAFRSGLDQLLQRRMVDIKNATDALAAAGNSALAQASRNCQSQGNPRASLAQLENTLNSARQNFASAKSTIESVSGDSLAAARALAVKSAADAFDAAIQKAARDIKALQF